MLCIWITFGAYKYTKLCKLVQNSMCVLLFHWTCPEMYCHIKLFMGAGAPFLTLTTIFYLIFFCICLFANNIQTYSSYFMRSILQWEIHLLQSNIGKWTYRYSKIVWSFNCHNVSCIYTLANSYQIWKMMSYHSLLITYAFFFSLKTLPSYITGQMVPPTQCSTRPISVCEQF